MSNLNIKRMKIKGVLILEPKVYKDERGFFYESYNKAVIENITKINNDFVQDNQSFSNKNVLRGLHLQAEYPQGKLVRVINGKIFDVIVDLRPNSPTFQKWEYIILSSDNRKQIWIPPGLAHGFYVLSDIAEVVYKTSNYWHPSSEITLKWDDQTIGINWPNKVPPVMSKKDMEGKSFKELLKKLNKSFII